MSSSIPLSAITSFAIKEQVAQTRALQTTRAQTKREPRVVAARRTPTSPRQYRAALARAYRQVTGSPASSATLDILTAHVSHETGHGRQMYNHNFGGIKGTSPAGLKARYQTHEYLHGDKTRMTASFRAYRSLDEGAADYVRTLATRYSAALQQAGAGHVDGFSSALKQKNYYTAPEEAYASAMRALVAQKPLGGSATRNIETAPDLLEPPNANVFPNIDIMRLVDRTTSEAAARLAAPIEQDNI